MSVEFSDHQISELMYKPIPTGVKSSLINQSTQTPCLLTQLGSFDERTRFLELSFSDFQVLESFARQSLNSLQAIENRSVPYFPTNTNKTIAEVESVIFNKEDDASLPMTVEEIPGENLAQLESATEKQDFAFRNSKGHQSTLPVREEEMVKNQQPNKDFTYFGTEATDLPIKEFIQEIERLTEYPQLWSATETSSLCSFNSSARSVEYESNSYQENLTNAPKHESRTLTINLIPLEQQETKLRDLHHCNVCQLTFQTDSLLVDHLRSHVFPTVLTSNIGSFSSDDSKGLEGLNPYVKPSFLCHKCKRSFNLSILLKKHICESSKKPKLTPNSRPFRCNHCSSAFPRVSALKAHLVTHTGEKPFECLLCSSRFTQRGSLKTHLLTHTGEKPFQCPRCDKRFAQKMQVKRHLATHAGEEPFQCSECGMNFTDRSELDQHLTLHAKEKPFKCHKCEKRFSQKEGLDYHLLRHEEVQPHQCSVCGENFIDKYDLASHSLIHVIMDHVSCPQCQKTFTRKSDLKRHLINVHKSNAI